MKKFLFFHLANDKGTHVSERADVKIYMSSSDSFDQNMTSFFESCSWTWKFFVVPMTKMVEASQKRFLL